MLAAADGGTLLAEAAALVAASDEGDVPPAEGAATRDAQPTRRTAASTEPIANGNGLLTPALSLRLARGG